MLGDTQQYLFFAEQRRQGMPSAQSRPKPGRKGVRAELGPDERYKAAATPMSCSMTMLPGKQIEISPLTATGAIQAKGISALDPGHVFRIGCGGVPENPAPTVVTSTSAALWYDIFIPVPQTFLSLSSSSRDPRGSLAHPGPRPPHYSGVVSSSFKYLMHTEVHTFAFSVAANAILSFFPFVVLLMTLIRRVFHSRTMDAVVIDLLRDYLPAGQDFVIRNLNALVSARQRVQLASLLILLVTSTGVFLPLEVALNRIWGFARNRSYIGNQLISLCLAFGCGVLALLSIALTAGNIHLVGSLLHGHANFLFRLIGFLVMKIFAIAASIVIFFLIYWILPNGKVPAGTVLPTAILMGLLSEALKFLYILALPYLNFQEVYGPFSLSVSLMFWAFMTGLLLLTGAHLSARGHAAVRTP